VQAELKRITNMQEHADGYANYQQWLANTQLEQQVSLEDYSVSNRGLRSGLAGIPDQVGERIVEFEEAGVDLLLLQFSPRLEEMERFSEQVIRPKAREVRQVQSSHAERPWGLMSELHKNSLPTVLTIGARVPSNCWSGAVDSCRAAARRRPNPPP
jgi:hypothetical protein